MAFYAGTKIFTGEPIPLESTVKRYEQIRPFLRPHMRYIIELRTYLILFRRRRSANRVALQYAEKIGKLPSGPTPWLLDGTIVTRNTMDSMETMAMHSAFRYALAIRLAVFYDAPVEVLMGIVAAGREFAPAAGGLIYHAEWTFIVGVVAVRTGGPQEDINTALEMFEGNKFSTWSCYLRPRAACLLVSRSRLCRTCTISADFASAACR